MSIFYLHISFKLLLFACFNRCWRELIHPLTFAKSLHSAALSGKAKASPRTGVAVQHLHGSSGIRLCMGSIDLMDLKRLDPINE